MKSNQTRKLARENRKKRRNSIIMGAVLIFLMTFGILGYSFNSKSNAHSNGADISNNFDYNGFSFNIIPIKDTNNVVYSTTIGSRQLVFYNDPRDVQGIYVAPDFQEALKNTTKFVLTSEPIAIDAQINNNQVYFDHFVKDLQSGSGKVVERASLSEGALQEYPLVTCDSASVDNPVIIMDSEVDEPGQVGIFNEDNKYCFRAIAEDLDIIKLRDRLLYLTNGIQ